MRPVLLSLEGFTSFRDKVMVSFDGLDLFVISGPTGAGKSSLLEAMTLALYGSVPRMKDTNLKELISLGRDRLAVVFEFRLGERRYRVARIVHRSRPTEAMLEEWKGTDFRPVEDGVRAVDAAVARLLGLDYDAFTQAVFLPQGHFAEFLKAQPGKRRELLTSILRLGVYEDMRKEAARREADHERQADTLEELIKRQYAGVSAEALAELEREEAAKRQEAEAAETELVGLRERLTAVRDAHAKTVELLAKERERNGLRQKELEVAELRRRVEAARRATGVVPLLDQADAAAADCARRVDVLARAERDHATAYIARDRAAQARAEAEGQAAAVPGLRARQMRLTEILGKLPLRDTLAEQCRQGEMAVAAGRDRCLVLAKAREALTADASALAAELTTAEAGLAQLGYDAELDGRLEQVRDDATTLQARADALAEERDRAERRTTGVTAAEARARVEAGRKEEADRVRQEAQAQRDTAADALRAGQDAHAAAHLRGGLAEGQPCPVCRQTVSVLPGDEPAPILKQLQQDLRRTELALRAAAGQAEKQAEAAAATQAAAQEARGQADEADRAVATLASEVEAAVTALATAVGTAVEAEPGETLASRVVAVAQRMAGLRQRHHEAEGHVRELRQAIAGKQHEAQEKATQHAELTAALAEQEQRLSAARTALAAVKAEIAAVAGKADPAAEAQFLGRQIQELESALVHARQVEAEAEQLVAGVEARVQQQRQESADAATRTNEAARAVRVALALAGFPDAAAARAAHQPPAAIDALEARVRDHENALHAVTERIDTLDRELAGRRVTNEELSRARDEHDRCESRGRAARTAQAGLEQRATTMHDMIGQADELRAKLEQQRRLQHVYERLADDLRSNGFQDYLLQETLGELVRGASSRLGSFTGDGYGLDLRDGGIAVIDRDNAGECRSADTLSGGETFLASLALALELSERVQRLGGAVRLDCLFIDEGFGTLDPETLRVVGEAVRNLQAGGRMVGVITHIPDLKDEFDQRVLVSREGTYSRVDREVA
jgi:exonuclease SbcC